MLLIFPDTEIFLKKILEKDVICLGSIFLTSCHRNQTRDGWVGNANATSGLCSPHLVLDVKKTSEVEICKTEFPPKKLQGSKRSHKH